jgi:putative ABC transport system substrate-binding protein
LTIEWRSAVGKWDALPEIIRHLVADNVDVIVAPNNHVTKAAKGVTQTVPVVMAGNALPVEEGFVESLARHGGNITALSLEVGVEIAGKKLEHIKELVPEAKRVAYLLSEQVQSSLKQQVLERAHFDVLIVEKSPSDDYIQTYALIMRERADVIFVPASIANFVNRRLIVDIAAQRRLPAFYFTREFVDEGGIISYGVNIADPPGSIVCGPHHKGTKPADLPVDQPTKFELVINLRTAKTLGIPIPSFHLRYLPVRTR